MKKTLIVSDCPDWAITSLCLPLRKAGADICYHYVNTSKGTGIGEKNPVHLTIDLLKNYDQIHFTTTRAVDNMLRNTEVLKAVKGKRLLMTVMTERETDLQLLKQPQWRRIDQFISPTKYQQEKIKEYTNKDSVYIPFAIDEKKYSYTNDYPRKTNVVGYVGRITPHKRLKSIVEASKGYKVVGIGYVDNDGAEYWKKIPRDNLTMYQNLSEDEKIEIMKSFTILVSISEPNIETGPLGVLEAAALGIPIVTTDVGWAKDMLKPNIDCIKIGDDDLELKDYLQEYIKRPRDLEAMRINARKVIDNWTLDMYIKAHKAVYD